MKTRVLLEGYSQIEFHGIPAKKRQNICGTEAEGSNGCETKWFTLELLEDQVLGKTGGKGGVDSCDWFYGEAITVGNLFYWVPIQGCPGLYLTLQTSSNQVFAALTPRLPLHREKERPLKNPESSSPGEFHPQALTDPDVTVSCHPALIIQLPSPATLPYPYGSSHFWLTKQ